MQLIKQEKARCEISRCKSKAAYTIDLDRLGIRSRIHICPVCLARLYAVIGDELIPKSYETIKKRNN